MRLGIVLTSALLLGGCGADIGNRADAFRADAARGRMAEYVQAQRVGDLLGMCVKSNLVSAAYRDAGDAANAEAWQVKNAADCRAAHAALTPDRSPAD